MKLWIFEKLLSLVPPVQQTHNWRMLFTGSKSEAMEHICVSLEVFLSHAILHCLEPSKLPVMNLEKMWLFFFLCSWFKHIPSSFHKILSNVVTAQERVNQSLFCLKEWQETWPSWMETIFRTVVLLQISLLSKKLAQSHNAVTSKYKIDCAYKFPKIPVMYMP